LKSLNLTKLTDAHLHKTLLKVKSFAESEQLPDEVKQVVPKPEGTEETLLAIQNVTSGMYNTKPVKDAMQQIVSEMYITMGIPTPTVNVKKKVAAKDVSKAKSLGESLPVHQKEIISSDDSAKQSMKSGSEEGSWEGFDSEEDEAEGDDHDEEQKGEEDSLDEDELGRYDALLGADSDEDSFNEEEYKAKNPPQLRQRISLSLSPTPSGSPSPSHSPGLSPSLSPELQPRPAKVPKAPKAKPAPTTGGSTFLPTLMGGYWSGSESSASDLEDLGPTTKKNRPGQAARRAIWEKKYGEKANHIKSGQAPIGKAKAKDDGWDAKRGAKESRPESSRGRRFGARGESQRGMGRNFENVTGENAIAIAPKPRGMGKKDDVGVLHPSWQAAKKAKEMKKTATFQGKKVTFD
jgi:hypothetical protein